MKARPAAYSNAPCTKRGTGPSWISGFAMTLVYGADPRSGSLWMPDRLHFHERGRLVGTASPAALDHAFHVVRPRSLGIGKLLGCKAGQVERVHISVARQPRCQFGRVAGEDVDDSPW